MILPAPCCDALWSLFGCDSSRSPTVPEHTSLRYQHHDSPVTKPGEASILARDTDLKATKPKVDQLLPREQLNVKAETALRRYKHILSCDEESIHTPNIESKIILSCDDESVHTPNIESRRRILCNKTTLRTEETLERSRRKDDTKDDTDDEEIREALDHECARYFDRKIENEIIDDEVKIQCNNTRKKTSGCPTIEPIKTIKSSYTNSGAPGGTCIDSGASAHFGPDRSM